MLFDERELLLSYDKIETVDFHQETEVEGIKFTAFNAGHVLGAAMFLIEIAGVKVEPLTVVRRKPLTNVVVILVVALQYNKLELDILHG
jgi:Cft2 family RNA processing exonuclease